MTPILIEKRAIFKLSGVLSFVSFALFFSGYLFGFHKAESYSVATAETLQLELPDKILVAETGYEQYQPAEVEPGIDRDVDVPDSSTAELLDMEGVVPSASIEKKDVISVVTDKTDRDTQATNEVAHDVPPLSATDEIQHQTIAVGGPVPSAEEDALTPLADNADETTAKYTIQVGLFSNEDNAERRVEDLLANRLSAYSTEYTTRNKSTRYNVRFGYYADYSAAKLALNTYKDVIASDGYIIKLKR